MTEEEEITRAAIGSRLRIVRSKGVLGAVLDGDQARRRQRMVLDGVLFGITSRLSSAINERTTGMLTHLRQGAERFTEKLSTNPETLQHPLQTPMREKLMPREPVQTVVEEAPK